MTSNEDYQLSKNTKTYRLLNYLSTCFLTSWLVKRDTYSEELKCFESLCTFIRTVTFLILYVLVLLFGLYSVIITLSSLSSLSFASAPTIFASVFVGVFVFVVVILSGFYSAEHYVENHMSDEEPKKEKKPNIFFQSIKDKHNKICRKITIKD